ncbi:unnamed protein product [Euphydryas editha]|uniref:MAGE domain-containing protein n=1 Tax=Euphydryas editha TaxID=104508 RepID=A0AAU9U5W8_EUPED|nr:unnamed protein product [Euphydryas editha]
MPVSLVNECVKYIICRDANKVPIDRTEIRSHLKKYVDDVSPKQFKDIISGADKILKSVYGYRLVQVGPKNDKYIVILKKNEKNAILSTLINPQHRKLLIAALTHIYMTCKPVKSDDMWLFLTTAQLMSHENESEVKKLLMKTFTQLMYLKCTKIDNDLCEFEWGQRAEYEIPKMFLLDKVAQAFDTEASYWTEQYRKAREEPSRDETVSEDLMEIE